MIKDLDLTRYQKIEKEMDYRFRIFDKKDVRTYINKMQKIINKSNFNEIEIIIKIREP